jgi:prepilin-type N-terminal cleavage/methylation domain-containing protein
VRSVRGAFTLIELLIAVVLFTLMMTVTYGSYGFAARTIARCQEGFAPFRDALKVQKVLQRVIASASASKQRNPKAVFEGEERRLSFTTLNRQGYDADHPWPMAYVRIAHDRDEGLTVISHATWFLYDKDDPTKGATMRFPAVKGLKLEYLDGKDWVREWDASKKGKLPGRVKLELSMDGPGVNTVPWVFQVPLVIQSELPIVGGGVATTPGAVPGAAGVPQFGNPGLQPAPGAANAGPFQPQPNISQPGANPLFPQLPGNAPFTSPGVRP